MGIDSQTRVANEESVVQVLTHPNKQKKEEMFVYKSNAGQKNAANETKGGD